MTRYITLAILFLSGCALPTGIASVQRDGLSGAMPVASSPWTQTECSPHPAAKVCLTVSVGLGAGVLLEGMAPEDADPVRLTDVPAGMSYSTWTQNGAPVQLEAVPCGDPL